VNRGCVTDGGGMVYALFFFMRSSLPFRRGYNTYVHSQMIFSYQVAAAAIFGAGRTKRRRCEPLRIQRICDKRGPKACRQLWPLDAQLVLRRHVRHGADAAGCAPSSGSARAIAGVFLRSPGGEPRLSLRGCRLARFVAFVFPS